MESFLFEILSFSLNRSQLVRSRGDQIDFNNMISLTKNTLVALEIELILSKLIKDVNKGFYVVGNLLTYLKSFNNKEFFPNFEQYLQNKFNDEEKQKSPSIERNSSNTNEDSIKQEKEKKVFKTLNNQKMQQIINNLFINFTQLPERQIGKYSPHLRIRKILNYKMKRLIKRKIRPLSRKFLGRSKVAKTKLRIRGRFVKKDTLIKKTLFKVTKGKNKINS